MLGAYFKGPLARKLVLYLMISNFTALHFLQRKLEALYCLIMHSSHIMLLSGREYECGGMYVYVRGNSVI
jgi:hypothetical protein